jgi:PAS domain S-box-containing protein
MSLAFRGLQDRNYRVVRRPSGEGRQKRGGLRSCGPVVFVLLLSFLLIQGAATAQVQPVRRILILNEVNSSYPGVSVINQGIETALSSSPYHLEIYLEHLDTGLFPDPAAQQEFRDFFIRKYQNRQPDVIVTVGPSTLQFMREAHQRAFPGVPIVFCLPIGDAPSASALGPDFTGVESDLKTADTLKVALRLQPGTEHMVVLGGVSDWDKHEQARFKQQAKGVTDHPEITFMTDAPVPELLKRLKHLPPHTIVLLLSFARDAEGRTYKSNEIAPLVAAAANAPVFSFYDVYLNHGEVGGYLSNLSEQGKAAGGMALRILRGEKPQDIPRVKGINTYMFDWRAVKRWGLKETEIPSGSIIFNRQPTLWESYKDYLIGGISLIALEALLIGGLLWQRARRRKVETDLAITNDQLRLAVEAMSESEQRFRLVANTAPVMIWMSGPDKLCNYFNKTWLEFTGRPFEAELGNGWAEGVHPEDLKACLDTYIQAFDRRESFSMQYRLRRYDREYRWLLDIGVPRSNPDGSFEGYIGSCIDVTDRRLAEEALTRMGRRLIEAHEEERTWIARELHDDVLQRMALLMVDLELWDKRPPDSAIDFREHMRHSLQRLSDIVDDIQALSHRLHSSKLEYLGIVAAARSFCQELTEQQKVEVDFSYTNIPDRVSKEISLCIFRVLQEALQNAVKYSGVRQFAVELRGGDGEIQLTVSDLGVGFNPHEAINGHGLGLISMRERLYLVRGQISIESRSGAGTTIRARVPFSSGSNSEETTVGPGLPFRTSSLSGMLIPTSQSQKQANAEHTKLN